MTIVTVGGTYDYSDLGCTHHCYGDIAMMRLVPNMQVFEPSSPTEFRKLFKKLGVTDYLNILDCPKNNTHKILK